MDASGIDRISFLFFLRITNFFVPFTNSLFGGCCDVKTSCILIDGLETTNYG